MRSRQQITGFCGFPWIRVRDYMSKKDRSRKVIISQGPFGHKLKQPVTVLIPVDLDEFEKATVNYIIESLAERMPRLISFAIENKSVLEMTKFLLKYRSGSAGTLRRYIYGLYKFCSWIGETPDEMIINCIDQDGFVDLKKLQKYAMALDGWVGILQARKMAPMTINASIT